MVTYSTSAGRLGTRGPRAPFFQRLGEGAGRPLRILDVGCGPGNTLRLLERHGLAFGLEYSTVAPTSCPSSCAPSSIARAAAGRSAPTTSSISPPWLNELLRAQIVWEHRLGLNRLLPFGVSLLCMARRPAE
jgi:SAM-dependent methyltransferase